MPIYPLKCSKCKHAWEEFCQASRRNRLRCPKGCKGRAETNFDKLTIRREREFFGEQQTSLEFGFDASEAAEAAKLFEGTGATIVQEGENAGDVLFANRGQQRRFRKRYAKLEKEFAEKNASGEQ